MGFNLESSKNNETNETPEVNIDSEQLSETEETAENFDDCSLNEVQQLKDNEVNAESIEEAEENYDDCEAKMEEMEENNSELAEEDDDFNDCGKDTDGQYVAEVTYTTDGRIDQEEASAELKEAYNECEDPEDMQQLKESANENEHIEVHNAEVVERPESDEITDKVTEEEYEQAQEELEESEETLEAQQEAAQEYKDDLENQINKNENEVPKGTENINNDILKEGEENSEELSETEEDTNDGDESDSDEISEDAEQLEDTEETKSSEVKENAEDIKSDGEQVGEQIENTKEIAETSYEDSEEVNKDISSETEKNAEDVESKDLDQMEDEATVEASEINDESVSEDVSQKVEEQTETELSNETKEKIQEDVAENINNEAEDGKISSEKAEEIIAENVEENVDNIEEQQESADETIDARADEIVENEDLIDDEAKEQIADEVKESSSENLSNEEAEEIAEEKSDEIEDAIEEKKEEQESVEAIEETTEELENDQIEQNSEAESKSLQERIDGAFKKDDVSSSEINDLREENATELQAKIGEKAATEAELKSKFDEVLSKEKGSEEYKQSLREYNALQDQKATLDEQIVSMEKQKEFLDKKSLELRDAQIQNGAEAVAAFAATFAGVSALQERYDQTYYATKPDKVELANIREESCSTIKELSTEKDSIKQAMDAKMDEISEYVTSNNMDRYDTAHDLRYQQLSAEYNAMRESYDKIRYSIVKLDENNKAITEQLGDEFHTMREAGCATFASYKIDKFGFIMGDNGVEYSNFWRDYDKTPSQVTDYAEPIVEIISPSKIEGIRMNDLEIDNPGLFWSMHMKGGSEESFNSIAKKIPALKERLDSGETLDSIINDSDLGDTAAIYFSDGQMPKVIKCGNYYEFQGNGRHRILAARNVNCDIPVKVIGERKFYKTTKEINKNFINNPLEGHMDNYRDEKIIDDEGINDLRNKFAIFLNKKVATDNVKGEIREVNNNIENAQKMIDDYCQKDLHNILPNEKKYVRLKDTVEFQDDESFARGIGKERAKGINGYNNGEKSYVKNSGPHPKKTAIHEHNHQLSCNDIKNSYGKVSEYRRGISIDGKDRQVNEALTELFTKKMMGVEYPANPNIAYKDNMLRIEKMEFGFGVDLLKKAYYQNKPELLKNKYESVMGKESWEQFSKAFDDTLCEYSDQEIYDKQEHYRKYGMPLRTLTDVKRQNAIIYANKCVTRFVLRSKGVN